MIDAHSSWIGLRASQGVAGSMPRHGTGPVGKRYLIGRCMRLAHSWQAGWLARFQAWRGKHPHVMGFGHVGGIIFWKSTIFSSKWSITDEFFL
jgi:hypothetical protein